MLEAVIVWRRLVELWVRDGICNAENQRSSTLPVASLEKGFLSTASFLGRGRNSGAEIVADVRSMNNVLTLAVGALPISSFSSPPGTSDSFMEAHAGELMKNPVKGVFRALSSLPPRACAESAAMSAAATPPRISVRAG
jgi:hypothetical protein